MWKVLLLILALSACTFGFDPITPQPGGGPSTGETAMVSRVIDGDTIDVVLNGQTTRVRYIGVNTPERDEVCYDSAAAANAALVQGKTVTLVKDKSETDIYDRLLRYIYVGDVFVNEQMVAKGYAEVVLYPPDGANFEYFRGLEQQAKQANLGCHPTGIFEDGTYER